MIKRNYQPTVNVILQSITIIVLGVLGLIIGLSLDTYINPPAQAAIGPVSFPPPGGRIVITPIPGPGQPPIYQPPPTPEELYSQCLAQGGGTCLFPNCGPTSIGGGGIATTGTACLVEVPTSTGGGIGIPGSATPPTKPTPTPKPTPTRTLTGEPPGAPSPGECPGEE